MTDRVAAVSFRILKPTQSQPPSVGLRTGDRRARVSIVSITHPHPLVEERHARHPWKSARRSRRPSRRPARADEGVPGLRYGRAHALQQSEGVSDLRARRGELPGRATQPRIFLTSRLRPSPARAAPPRSSTSCPRHSVSDDAIHARSLVRGWAAWASRSQGRAREHRQPFPSRRLTHHASW
jgi:hypothetical protein